MTASLWVGLLAVQSWSIHHGRRPLHRLAGRASLVLFPLFWTSGLLIVQMMARGFATADNHFHTIFGARLTPVDILTSACTLYLYHLAVSRRREVLVHAAAMLAILLFLLSPIIVRLLQIGGPLAIRGPDQYYKFAYELELSNLLSILIGLWLYSRRPRTAWPFLIAAAAVVAQSLAFETVGRTPAWEAAVRAIAALPTIAVAVAGVMISALAVWHAWTARKPNIGSAEAITPRPGLV
ncbi:MAG: hypothetical protein JF628_01895 [Sphingomonas sp.]|nr:hypothetical protein [Sphingomonas sp.]